MSLLRNIAFGAVLAMLGVGTAQATLITDTYTATITSRNDSAFRVGDTFNWSVTYDDESTQYNTYRDGADGISNFGGGDDELLLTYDSSDAVDPYCLPFQEAFFCSDPNYTYVPPHYSDAVIDYSEFLTVMGGLAEIDFNDTNQNSIILDGAFSGMGRIVSRNDVIRFNGTSATTVYDLGDRLKEVHITWLNVRESRVTVNVPEPSALALMGLGLLGFVATRRKIKK